MKASGESNTLEWTEKRVSAPISPSRRKRYWIFWWLWAVFGAAVSFRGMPMGSWLAVAAILTAPFWALFILWPIFWLRDRIRARSLWTEEVALLVSSDGLQSGHEAKDDAAIPVVVGKDRSVFVPAYCWQAAFPSIDPQAFGVKCLAADLLSGVHFEGYEGHQLVKIRDKLEETACDDSQEVRAARKWLDRLESAFHSLTG